MTVRPVVSFAQLRLYVTLAEELHFGRTAARAGMTAGAVSRHLREVEDAVGTKLMTRSTRRVELTAAGIALRDGARDALAVLDDGLEAACSPRPTALTLDIPADLPESWYRAAVRWAGARDAPLRIVRGMLEATIQDLTSGALEAAVVLGDLDDAGVSPDLPCEPITETDVLALLPADHPQAARPAIAGGGLAGWPVVVPEQWSEDQRRTAVARLTGDPDTPYVVAPVRGSIAEGQIRAAQTHRAVTVLFALDAGGRDVDGFTTRPLDPPWTVPVTLVARAAVGLSPFGGLAADLRVAGGGV